MMWLEIVYTKRILRVIMCPINSTAHLCQYLAFTKLIPPLEFHLLSQKPREVSRIYIIILRRSNSCLGMIPLSGRWETRAQVFYVMFFLHLVPLLDALFLDPVITVRSVTRAQYKLEEVFSGHWRCSNNKIVAMWTFDVFSQSFLPLKNILQIAMHHLVPLVADKVDIQHL